MQNDDRYFRTSSFGISVFLLAKNIELADIDKISNSKRATFVFVNCPDLQDLLQAFNYGKDDDLSVMVDVRRVLLATRQLKEKLYQDTF